MTDDKHTGAHYVAVPVADLEALSRHMDGTADGIDASRRRIEADTGQVELNRDDPGFSPSAFRSRLQAVADGLRRAGNQLRATAGLTADTAAQAQAGDVAGSPTVLEDSPVASVDGVVDRLTSRQAEPSPAPDWRKTWQTINNPGTD